jgi:pimeloyl-ACP methyl ester carboxylesterase
VWHTHIVLGSAQVAQVDTVQNAHPSIRNAYRIIATESAFTRGAFQKLPQPPKRLVLVPGAGHLVPLETRVVAINKFLDQTLGVVRRTP